MFSVPPDALKIRQEPEKIYVDTTDKLDFRAGSVDKVVFRAGTVGKLICDAGSSNPEPTLTFWRDGIEIESIHRKSKPGLYAGNTSSIVTQLNITADMSGNLFSCQAVNPKWSHNQHKNALLSVLCKFNKLD